VQGIHLRAFQDNNKNKSRELSKSHKLRKENFIQSSRYVLQMKEIFIYNGGSQPKGE